MKRMLLVALMLLAVPGVHAEAELSPGEVWIREGQMQDLEFELRMQDVPKVSHVHISGGGEKATGGVVVESVNANGGWVWNHELEALEGGEAENILVLLSVSLYGMDGNASTIQVVLYDQGRVVAELSVQVWGDASPPRGTLNLRQWLDSDEVVVRWDRVEDEESPVQYYFAVTGGKNHVVTLGDEESNQRLLALGKGVGDQFVHVRARSAGGWGEQETILVGVPGVVFSSSVSPAAVVLGAFLACLVAIVALKVVRERRRDAEIEAQGPPEEPEAGSG